MEDAMREVVEEGAKCPVNMGMLPAFVTIWTGELRTAVQTFSLLCVPRFRFTSLRLDRSAHHAAGHRISDCFESPDHQPPRPLILGSAPAA